MNKNEHYMLLCIINTRIYKMRLLDTSTTTYANKRKHTHALSIYCLVLEQHLLAHSNNKIRKGNTNELILNAFSLVYWPSERVFFSSRNGFTVNSFVCLNTERTNKCVFLWKIEVISLDWGNQNIHTQNKAQPDLWRMKR